MTLFPPTILLFLLLAFLAELIWAHARGKRIYNPKESLTNLVLFIGGNLIRPLSLAWKALVFGLLEPWQAVQIPSGAACLLLTFVAVEFTYYWYHRLSHEIPILWTIHHTHHSGSRMNLTTAARLNWLGGFLAPLFFAPLVLLGFSTELIIGSLTAGLLYQYFLHTEAIGVLGPFEGVLLNTPSAHRVHHGANKEYLDTNYGAVLIVFDRLFGTWQPEKEPVNYGVTTGPVSYNPFRVVFGPLIHYLLGRRSGRQPAEMNSFTRAEIHHKLSRN